MNIAEASTWLANKMFSVDGETAVYSRESTELTVTVTTGKSNWETDSNDGVIVNSQSTDFFVKSEDIAILSYPQSGDIITYKTRQYVVVAPGDEKPWQWADWPNKGVYRIHTKQA